MPINISGKKYYRTSEAAQLAGISRSTLLRWIDQGIFKHEPRWDRRGWRLFTEADIKRIESVANHVRQPARLIQ